MRAASRDAAWAVAVAALLFVQSALPLSGQANDSIPTYPDPAPHAFLLLPFVGLVLVATALAPPTLAPLATPATPELPLPTSSVTLQAELGVLQGFDQARRGGIGLEANLGAYQGRVLAERLALGASPWRYTATLGRMWSPLPSIAAGVALGGRAEGDGEDAGFVVSLPFTRRFENSSIRFAASYFIRTDEVEWQWSAEWGWRRLGSLEPGASFTYSNRSGRLDNFATGGLFLRWSPFHR